MFHGPGGLTLDKTPLPENGGNNIKRKVMILTAFGLAATLIFTSCGSSLNQAETSGEETTAESETEAEVSEEETPSDQEAADNVAKLIDAIYVQQRTEDTDEQCTAAKEAWDALTDAQKELVSGENADPDYFGRDTLNFAKKLH